MVTEDIHKILAVNYLGPVAVCKHFLPLLRESQGRIVNIASNCGKCQYYWEKVKAELLILLETVVSVNITERKSRQNC